ncbi:MAG: hypothetical protein WCJ46_02315 [bacterium]
MKKKITKKKMVVALKNEHKVVTTDKNLIYLGSLDTADRRYFVEVRKTDAGTFLNISEAKIPGDVKDEQRIAVPLKFLKEFHKMIKGAYISTHNAFSEDKIKKF